MKRIEFEISRHPKLGLRRLIKAKRVQFIDYEHEECEFWWSEHFMTEQGEVIEDQSIKPRVIITPISNGNKVTEIIQGGVTYGGIMISAEMVRRLNPQLEGESDEGYSARMTELENELRENGTKEMDFWLEMVNQRGWDATLLYAGQLLAMFNRFDEK